MYTYTPDLPYTNAASNRREFYRLPRSILLPPYLSVNPYFVEYTDSLDSVFDLTVEAKIEALTNIRNMWVSTPHMEQSVLAGDIIEFKDWGGPDRATVVRQVNLLGMKLSTGGVISETSYRSIAKFLGEYWFEKGKASSIDFLNFCLGTDITIEKRWTEDYVTFLSADDPLIGATIYDDPPGPWYPTTHVAVSVPGTYLIEPLTLGTLFYEIANYNLVLQLLLNVYEGSFVDKNGVAANIVCMAIGEEAIYNIESEYYDLSRHSTVGGWTGGVGRPLTQINF